MDSDYEILTKNNKINIRKRPSNSHNEVFMANAGFMTGGNHSILFILKKNSTNLMFLLIFVNLLKNN